MSAEWSPGRRIGPYALAEPIGRGGTGLVWRATDTRGGPDVAVKLLRILDPHLAARQVREVRLQARVDSPNVVRVLDVRQEGDVPVLVLELVQGPTLLELLKAGRLSLDAARELAEGLFEGLAAVHAQGLVHRDLKPGNVLVQRDPTVAKILDFGLARPSDEPEMTRVGAMLGTPGYMAPEQIVDARDVDARADLFALGVILFRMVTGTMPFRAPDRFEVLRKTRAGDRPTLGELNPDLPAPLAAAIDAALRPHRQDRPADVAALRAIWRGEQAPSPAAALDPESTPAALVVPPPTAPVPVADRPLVGRAAEQARWAEAGRLVTLLGPAGSGKTRLAMELAKGGGTWVEVGGEEVDEAVRQALQLTPGADLVAALARGPDLLVLDGADAAAEGAAEPLERWLRRVPALRVLVTSRVVLGARGESVVEVGPLAPADAVALFEERAAAVRPGGVADRAAVAELVDRVDRLPLAIELLAARTRALPPRRLLERWGDGLEVLAPRDRDGLMEAIAGSWALLPAWGRRALAQCTAFVGGFSLEAAEAVIDLSDDPRAPWPMDVVQLLVDHSLVAATEPVPGHERYRLYGPIRAFAAARADDGEAAARHARWFARAGDRRAMRALTGRAGARRTRSLWLDRDNLAAAQAWAEVAGDGATAAGCALARAWLFRLHGPFVEGADAMLRAQGLPGVTDEQQARLHRQRGRLLTQAGEPGAREALVAAHDGFAALGDDRARGIVLGNLGDLDAVAGLPDLAAARYDESRRLLRAVGDGPSEAVVLGNVANLLRQQGRRPEARAAYEEALALSRAAGERRAEAMTLGNLASLHLEAGRSEEARQAYDRAIALAEVLGDESTEALMRGNRALLDRDAGRTEEARRGFEGAIARAQAVGSRRIEGLHRGNLGDLLWSLGEADAAREQLERAVALGDAVWPLVAGAFRGSLAVAAAAAGDLERARTLFDEGAALLDGVDAGERRRLLQRRADAGL